MTPQLAFYNPVFMLTSSLKERLQKKTLFMQENKFARVGAPVVLLATNEHTIEGYFLLDKTNKKELFPSEDLVFDRRKDKAHVKD